MSVPELGEAPAEATVASKLATYLRAGGIVTPLITLVFAFLIGGLVVLITGHDPIATYKAIFNGTGLNWLFPWTSSADRQVAAINLQQTLIATTPLILTGLAVAFAFRCGLFNIGGQGQYQMGAIAAVWVGSSFAHMAGLPHILLAIVAACAAGAVWAGIAGLLRAVTGASEVITTIMLNYTALWIGFWLFSLGGPLQSDTRRDVPISNDIVGSAHLPVFWGDPEAARSSGISVARNYVVVMAICGLFAGLGGALDVLGWQFRINTNDIQVSTIGFFGIAVALLGRNTAIGTMFAALLFGALLTGTSVRNLDPAVFDPQLASNLTSIIQGLVVLLISTDVLVVYLWRLRRRRARRVAEPAVGVS